MLRRIVTNLWAVLLLGMLAACGGASTPAPPAATAVQPARAPVAPTAAAAQAPTAAPAAAVSQPESPGEAALPEGLTPEGYHVLGRPDAPVTLVMYSDFL